MKASACAKHFAIHSGPETKQHEFNAVASPKDISETYIPAFKALAEAKVESFTCAYNQINGEPCCGNPFLLVDILREKWDYKG